MLTQKLGSGESATEHWRALPNRLFGSGALIDPLVAVKSLPT